MISFAATVIVDLIRQTYFYGIQQMGMKDTSLIDKIDPTFSTLTTMAIQYCLFAWNTDKFRIPPVAGPGA